MRNILVTGANGQLGSSIRALVTNPEGIPQTSALQGELGWYFSDVSSRDGFPVFRLDITDLCEIKTFVRNHDIGIIVNCAAYTNVDAAEDNEELAELLNAQAVENLAVAMKEVGGLLVHVSTDYVFGGEPYNTPCMENQKGTPTGVYGETKLHGEQAIQRIGCHHVIIRTAWLYSEFGKNFVKTMLNLTAIKPQLNVVFDQTGTPTYALDLAKAIVDIIENRKYDGKDGIYHYSNEGVCSWYDFAKMIAEYAGHTDCEILPCHSDEYQSKVQRPSYSVLDKTKIKETLGIEIPYWTDSLKKCISNLKK